MEAVPDLDALLAAVRLESPRHFSPLHGEPHWRAVAEAGLRLADGDPAVDRSVLFLFALFHDSMRVNDHEDLGHGRRGAELAERFHGAHFQLGRRPLSTLLQACSDHSDVRRSDDPTIGACLDADRLNLWRVGTVPEPQYLSTPAALDEELREWSRNLHGRARAWPELFRSAGARS